MDQPLVKVSVDLGSPTVYHSVSEDHVLLVSSDSPESKSDNRIPVDQGGPPLVPVEQRGSHTIPPPSSSVVSFD